MYGTAEGIHATAGTQQQQRYLDELLVAETFII
jgi:hypothetical protein